MNEQIKELALQSGLVRILEEHAHEYGNGMFENTLYPELEKFVELIVRKCAIVGNYAYDGGEYPGGMIKEYFGIKE